MEASLRSTRSLTALVPAEAGGFTGDEVEVLFVRNPSAVFDLCSR